MNDFWQTRHRSDVDRQLVSALCPSNSLVGSCIPTASPPHAMNCHSMYFQAYQLAVVAVARREFAMLQHPSLN